MPISEIKTTWKSESPVPEDSLQGSQPQGARVQALVWSTFLLGSFDGTVWNTVLVTKETTEESSKQDVAHDLYLHCPFYPM